MAARGTDNHSQLPPSSVLHAILSHCPAGCEGLPGLKGHDGRVRWDTLAARLGSGNAPLLQQVRAS